MLIINMNSLWYYVNPMCQNKHMLMDHNEHVRHVEPLSNCIFFFEQFFTVFVICTFLSIAFGFLYPSFLVLIWHFGCEDFDKDLGEVTLCVTLENDNFILKIP